jgi:hypothetical protein
MLHFKQNLLNSCDVTVSNESELNNPTYLWCLTNLDSMVKKYFIPYNATIPNATRYDTFTFTTNRLEPEVLTGSTCNLHLAQGQYRYTIYDQISSTNLDPLLSNSMVETGLGLMPQEEVCFNTYEDDNPFSEAVVYEDPTCFYTYISPNETSIMFVYYDPTCKEKLKWNKADVDWNMATFNWEDPYPVVN